MPTLTHIYQQIVLKLRFMRQACNGGNRQMQKREIERAFCAVRPPGHHAEAEKAMGFCIFNNVAVGARYAQKRGYKNIHHRF